MRNKKILCFLVLFCLTVVLFGCDGKTGERSENEKELTMPIPQNTHENYVDKTHTGQEDGELLEKPSVKRVSFVGCGDNIIYYDNVRDARSLSEGDEKYNFKPMYEPVKEMIETADIAFINQETVMAGDGYELSYYPRFNSPRKVGYDLLETGYDVINIANNHMLDKGADGLLNTIEFWKEQN